MEVLDPIFQFNAYGGTSGGGLVALALAKGMTPRQVSDMCDQILQRKDLLDFQFQIPLIGSKTGVFKGAKIDALLQEVFGKTACMGDLKKPARVTASSMWTKRASVVCSVAHPDVLVWRAARATMNIEGMFELVRLREDNARTYGDGGAGLNVPGGLWDDHEGATVCVRFARQQKPYSIAELIQSANGDANGDEAVPVRNEKDVLAATFDIAMDSSSAAFPCRKPQQRYLELAIDCNGDSLKFGLDRDEIVKRRQTGIDAARRFVATSWPQIMAMPKLVDTATKA